MVDIEKLKIQRSHVHSEIRRRMHSLDKLLQMLERKRIKISQLKAEYMKLDREIYMTEVGPTKVEKKQKPRPIVQLSLDEIVDLMSPEAREAMIARLQKSFGETA